MILPKLPLDDTSFHLASNTFIFVQRPRKITRKCGYAKKKEMCAHLYVQLWSVDCRRFVGQWEKVPAAIKRYK